MIISIQDRAFVIQFPYNPRVLKAVKKLPGRIFYFHDKSWRVPMMYKDMVEAFAHTYGFQFEGDQPKEIIGTAPEMPELDIDIPLKMELFPYQKKGIAQSLKYKRLIIGDDMGLGKTAQAIATIAASKAFPCLVICPASLKINWQREFALWTNIKCMIMNDGVRGTWPLFYETGMVQVFIVNYESLKKYYVNEIKKEPKQALRLNHIHFNERINLFKSIIIDESHRCLPYNTKILTNKGLFKIGDIVENKVNNLLVASCDLSNKSVTYNKILNYWRNDIGQRKIYRIRHNEGWFYATENHKIYTNAGRYKEVCEIKSGEGLYILREQISDREIRENDSSLLRKELRFKSIKQESADQDENGCQEKDSSIFRKKMRLVWNVISGQNQQQDDRNHSILQSKLLSEMENVITGNKSIIQYPRKEREGENISNTTNEGSKIKENAFGSNEEKQSNVIQCGKTEDDFKNEGENISFERGKRADNNATKNTMSGIESPGFLYGIFHKNRISYWLVRFTTSLLQGRYRNRTLKISNRNRWVEPQNKEVEIFGQSKNEYIECVRVESIEVYKPASYAEYKSSSYGTGIVYDLEIDVNHNYFADGILVSNCKDSETQQAKFVKGVCQGKEYILALTGTPVVNKPRDLVSQLGIIDRLKDLGGYKHFMNRYCQGDNGAQNLLELNYLLNKHCYYRRSKQEVLKDLPDKMRQQVLCEITTRVEYKAAVADLASYLVQYRQATDEQVKRAMRGEVMVKIGVCKNISARGKMPDVVEYLSDVMESGEKIVLFVHLREIATELKKKFPKAVTILGEDDMNTRQRNIDAFQTFPDVKIIICSIKAAGVGITLTASSRVYFLELPWTYADCDQAESRCHRIGQKDSVQCTYFLGKDTIDEWVYDIIMGKKEIADKITGNTDQIEHNIIDGIMNLMDSPKN